MGRGAARTVRLSREVPTTEPRWVLDDDARRVPESPLQGEVCRLLMAVLERQARQRNASALVGGHIALRWDAAHPRTGVDPDVYLIEPAPPLSKRDKSVRTWVKGHHPPRVAVEVVSESIADEDYHQKPAKYAVSGTRELWVFDPLRLGPKGDRCALQVWRRLHPGTRRRKFAWGIVRIRVAQRRQGSSKGQQPVFVALPCCARACFATHRKLPPPYTSGFRRVYAGDGPAFSEELGAWIVITDEGTRLRIADDEEGRRLWPTEAEAERAAKEAALAEVERLRAQLAKLQG